MYNFEQIGFIPRSIIRTLKRFLKQISLKTDLFVIYEFRVSRYIAIASLQCFFFLIICPWIFHFFVKFLFLHTFLKYKILSTDIFMNFHQQERAFSQIQTFSQKIYFETLLESFEMIHKNQRTGRADRTPPTRKKELGLPINRSKDLRTFGQYFSLPPGLSRPCCARSKRPRGSGKPNPRSVFFSVFFIVKQGATEDPLLLAQQAGAFNLAEGQRLSRVFPSSLGSRLQRLSQLDFPKQATFLRLPLPDWAFFAQGEELNVRTVSLNGAGDIGFYRHLSFSPVAGRSQLIGAPTTPRTSNLFQEFYLSDQERSVYSLDSSVLQNPMIRPSAQIYQIYFFKCANFYNQQSVTILTNWILDLVTLLFFLVLLILLTPQILILKTFCIESLLSLSETTKCFFLIFFLDLLVGFHSSKSWEIFLQFFIEHFGFHIHQNFIAFFISTFPVLLDTIFKYWIFRYLNKISPSTVATYQAMIE